MMDSYDEIKKVLSLIDKKDISVYKGDIDEIGLINKKTVSEGVRIIIDEALKKDERPIYIACLGAITDMAHAILLCPEIANKISLLFGLAEEIIQLVDGNII